MARSPTDWRNAALDRVDEALVGLTDPIRHDLNDARSSAITLRAKAKASDPDRDELREQATEIENALVDIAQDCLDAAYEVGKLRSGSTFRNLQGEEPIGYSKPDYGVSHDAVYGSRAQGLAFSRSIRWPLNLGEWDVEKADRKHEPPGYEPVTASGIKKYTKRTGGRTVSLVVGPTDPPV